VTRPQLHLTKNTASHRSERTQPRSEIYGSGFWWRGRRVTVAGALEFWDINAMEMMGYLVS